MLGAIAAVTLCVSTLTAQRAIVSERIGVFVMAKPNESGFIDPGVPDSVRDIRAELGRRRSVRLVDTEASADIVIDVLGREKLAGPTGAVAVPVGGAAIVAPYTTTLQKVAAEMRFGEYRRPVTGISEGAWRSAAAQIAKDVDEWAEVNRAAIRVKLAR